MKLPEAVQIILTTLEKAGFEAYVVGGSVRDWLMGKNPEDFDITTNALPKEIIALFPKTLDIGSKFGTIGVLTDDTVYEITTFREDGEYLDYRRPQNVNFTNSLLNDLSRRDFTINAMAYNKNLTDPFGGQKDIEAKLIRAVNDPLRRFKEDALRMLRCIRFSARLNFNIEKNTCDAIVNLAPLIKKISPERIQQELTGIILSDYPGRALPLVQTKLLYYIDKELYICLKPDFLQTLKLIAAAPEDLEIRLSVLLMNYDKTEIFLKNLKFSNQVQNMVKNLIKAYRANLLKEDTYALKKAYVELGDLSKSIEIEKIFGKDISVIKALYTDFLNKKEPVLLRDLKITGNVLKAHGFTGKEIGNVLRELQDLVLRNPGMNTQEKLLNFVKNRRHLDKKRESGDTCGRGVGGAPQV